MPIKTGFKTGSSASTAYDIAGNFVTQDYVSETYPNLSSNVRGGGLAVAGRWQSGGTVYTTPYQFQGGQWKKVVVAAGANGNQFSYWAIKSDGTLWGWGKNTNGQLGLGDTVDRSTPTQIGSDTDWVDLGYNSAYEVAFYALKSNGTMYSCGYNLYSSRNLINGSNTTTLTALSGTWKKIISHDGDQLIYFIDSNNVAYGTGVQYSAGDFPISPGGGSYQAYQPTALLQNPAGVNADVKTVKSFNNGNSTTLIKNSGQAWIWRNSLTAVQASGSDWKDGVWKFLVKKDGTLWCLDMANISAAPVQTNIVGVRTIFRSNQFFYVIKTDGSLWWFKDNSYNANQYKISTADQLTSIELETSMYLNVNCAGLRGYWNADSALNKYNVVAVTDSEVQDRRSLGFKFGSSTSDTIDLGDVFVKKDSLSTANTLYGFLGEANQYDSGIIRAFGNGGTTSVVPTPIKIGTSSWKKVVAGGYTSAGIKSDGTLWSWGTVGYGANPYDTNVPVQIGSDSDWVDVAVLSFNVFAIKKNGIVYARGVDSMGMLGRGYYLTTGSPSPHSGSFEPVVSITNAKKFIGETTVLDHNGNIWMWGSTQAISGVAGAAGHTPVIAKTNVKEAINFDYVVYYKEIGSDLWKAWGYQGNGTLAPITSTYGTSITAANATALPDQYQFTKIFGNSSTLYAIDTSGSIWAWGDASGYPNMPLSSVQFTPKKLTAAGTGWKSIIPDFANVYGVKYDGRVYRLGANGAVGSQLNLPPIKSADYDGYGVYFFLTY